VGVLDCSGLLASRSKWSVVIGLAATAFVVVQVPAAFDVFTISKALHLLPFFLLGYGMRRHCLFDLRGKAAAAAAVVFAGIYVFRLLTIFGVYRPLQFVDRLI